MLRAISVLMVWGLGAAPVLAQERDLELAGAARIHTDLSILSVIGSADVDAEARFGFSSTLGFGAGYMATEELLIGTRFGIAYIDPIIDVSFLPYLEYVGAPSDTVRVGMMLSAGVEVLAAGGDSSTFGVIGGGPVLHGFLGDTLFSLDPAFIVQGLFGEGASAWNIQLLLGFSGWPGAQRERPPEPARYEEREAAAWRPATGPRVAQGAANQPAPLVRRFDLQGTQVSLAGHPGRNPELVGLRFTRTVPTQSWQECTEAYVTRDGQKYALKLKYAVMQHGVEFEERLQTSLGIAFVDSWYGARELHFEVCGEVLESTITSRTTTRAFVQTFRQQSRNYYGSVVPPIPEPPLVSAEPVEAAATTTPAGTTPAAAVAAPPQGAQPAVAPTVAPDAAPKSASGAPAAR